MLSSGFDGRNICNEGFTYDTNIIIV